MFEITKLYKNLTQSLKANVLKVWFQEEQCIKILYIQEYVLFQRNKRVYRSWNMHQRFHRKNSKTMNSIKKGL